VLQTFNESGVPVSVWTSTLRRTIATANYLPYPKLRWKALDEIHAVRLRAEGGGGGLRGGGLGVEGPEGRRRKRAGGKTVEERKGGVAGGGGGDSMRGR